MSSIEELINELELDAPHEHDWWVFSTAIQDVVIMCQCRDCGAFGIVEEHSREEWGQAFHAPSHPYRWHDPERVIVKSVPRPPEDGGPSNFTPF